MIEEGMDATIDSGSIGCHGNKSNACTYDSATFGKDMTPSTLFYSNFPSFFCFLFVIFMFVLETIIVVKNVSHGNIEFDIYPVIKDLFSIQNSIMKKMI